MTHTLDNSATPTPHFRTFRAARFCAMDAFFQLTRTAQPLTEKDSTTYQQFRALIRELYCFADLESLTITPFEMEYGRQVQLADDYGFCAIAWIELAHTPHAFFYWEA